MKLIFLTAEDCNLCEDAKKAFEKQYNREISTLEAEIRNLDEDEQMQELWLSHDEIPLAPVVILTTDDYKRVISQIEVNDLLETKPAETKEASPVAAAEAAAVAPAS